MRCRGKISLVFLFGMILIEIIKYYNSVTDMKTVSLLNVIMIFSTVLYKIPPAMPIGSFPILIPSSGIMRRLSINPLWCRPYVRRRVDPCSRRTWRTWRAHPCSRRPGPRCISLEEHLPTNTVTQNILVFYNLNLYHHEYTAWHIIFEVKQGLTPLIVRWVNAWELLFQNLFRADTWMNSELADIVRIHYRL